MMLDRRREPLSGLQRVIVADDHVVIRTGLAKVLEANRSAVVVASVGTGDDLVRTVFDPRTAADLVLLDLGMPGGGIPLIESLRALRPSLRILVYSMADDREWALRCLSAGADGYVSKSSEIELLVEAIGRIGSGRRFVGPRVAEQLVELMVAGDDVVLERPHVRLSNREMDVFTRLAAGETTGAIAVALGLSPKTITTYRSRVLEKLGLSTNADLIRYGIRHGLLSPEPTAAMPTT